MCSSPWETPFTLRVIIWSIINIILYVIFIGAAFSSSWKQINQRLSVNIRVIFSLIILVCLKNSIPFVLLIISVVWHLLALFGICKLMFYSALYLVPWQYVTVTQRWFGCVYKGKSWTMCYDDDVQTLLNSIWKPLRTQMQIF